MRYFNLSALGRVRDYWYEFPFLQRLTTCWVALTLLISVVFWISESVIPENPTVFRYFISLYGINSLVFFLTMKEGVILPKVLLVFLFMLLLLAGAYYGFNYLSLGVA